MNQRREKRRKIYNVSAKNFCRVWQTASSTDEVAVKLGMPRAIVAARASAYRTAGVKLKHMPRRNRQDIKIRDLNAMIDRINAGLPADGPDNGKAKPRARIKGAKATS